MNTGNGTHSTVSYQTMSRAEADKIITWVEDNLTVCVPPWQKEIFATLLMYPDLEFQLPTRRKC